MNGAPAGPGMGGDHVTDPSKDGGDDALFARDERFRKAERLLSPGEYARVRRASARYVSGGLVVLVASAKQPWSRVGITVSRKVGNAVVRNKVKRRLREVFRRNKALFSDGYDFVWIARRRAATTSYADLASEAIEGSRRALERLERSAKHVPSKPKR